MFCCLVFSHKFSTHHRTVLKQMKLKITFYNYSMSRKRTQKVNIQMKSFTSRQGREWINLHVRPCKKKTMLSGTIHDKLIKISGRIVSNILKQELLVQYLPGRPLRELKQRQVSSTKTGPFTLTSHEQKNNIKSPKQK